jgi:hypothetical protein
MGKWQYARGIRDLIQIENIDKLALKRAVTSACSMSEAPIRANGPFTPFNELLRQWTAQMVLTVHIFMPACIF